MWPGYLDPCLDHYCTLPVRLDQEEARKQVLEHFEMVLGTDDDEAGDSDRSAAMTKGN